ncbi:hypothetical protein [Streptomyces sp. FH025]|uniref:hypothetical protein n=1 Tax=Streptomyces sp. FH025 TaxID=2815937 RepID=UPI001A9DEFCC|nr:hypothetical protein [Streptomyces sp. FH025]MBO1413339.1 hypothetical protein [Streptomyces sp. FH025]
MNREFFQALTHSGPSYELKARDASAGGVAQGFWGALTHSGPSYTAASIREVADREAEHARLDRGLDEAIGRWSAAMREAEASMEGMDAAGNVDDRRTFFNASVDALERLAVIAEEDLSPVLRAYFKVIHPLDFLNRRLHRKTLRLTLRSAEQSARLASLLKRNEDLVVAGDAAAEKSVRDAYREFSSIPDRGIGQFLHLARAA